MISLLAAKTNISEQKQELNIGCTCDIRLNLHLTHKGQDQILDQSVTRSKGNAECPIRRVLSLLSAFVHKLLFIFHQIWPFQVSFWSGQQDLP